MELKIFNPTEDGFIKSIDWNFEELKTEITAKAALYKNMVYTDDSIKEAKADKAALNKFITALEDQRKAVKKQCLQPYETFEKQMKELVAIVNEPVQLIDQQVKAYEDSQKAEKLEKITEYYASVEPKGFEWLGLPAIYDQRWLNASVSMKKVQEAIEERLAQIAADVKTLESLPEFSFEAMEVYKQTLDLNRAIAEGQRLADIQKRKAEAAAAAEAARLEAEAEKARLQEEAGTHQVDVVLQVEHPDGSTVPLGTVSAKVPAKQWVAFEALLSTEDAQELKKFCDSRKIEIRAI